MADDNPMEIVEEGEAQVEEVQETEAVETPSIEEAPIAEPQKQSLNDEVEINIAGRTENITRGEYEYLARLGAHSLFNQQAESQAAEREGLHEAGPEGGVPQPDVDQAQARRLSPREGELADLQGQLHQAQVEAESQKIQNYVEDSIYNSETFKAMNQLEASNELLGEVRKEIYNKSAQENLTPEQSFQQVESKYSSLLGGDRKNFLMKKLRAAAEAVPGLGGSTKPPAKPMDAADWRSGKLLDSISEKLNAADI